MLPSRCGDEYRSGWIGGGLLLIDGLSIVRPVVVWHVGAGLVAGCAALCLGGWPGGLGAWHDGSSGLGLGGTVGVVWLGVVGWKATWLY